MKTRSKPGLLLLATTCAIPFAAMAQNEFELKEGGEAAPKKPVPVYLNSFDVGAIYNSSDEFRHARYNGMHDSTVYALGGASMLYMPDWKTDDTGYFKATGDDLGLESRHVRVEGGLQGQLRLFGLYEGLPNYQFEGQTPYSGVGTSLLNLPSPWTAATTAPGLTRLIPNLREVDIKTQRDRYGGGLSWNALPGLDVSSKFQREEKKGLKTLGVAWGTNGGNPLAIIVPEPVNYQTDTWDAKVGYVSGPLQLQFGYQLSAFNNKIDSFGVQDPYDGPNNGDYPTYAAVQGPPDNTAHQVRLAGGYNFTDTLRLVANLGYGVHLQDATFLGYTSNYRQTVTTPVPRSSLDGKLTTTLANIEVTERPTKDLDMKARYRFTDRDNDTPRNLYIYVTGDSENQGTISGDSARNNLPYSFTEHLGTLDFGYRLDAQHKLLAGYEYKFQSRTFSERTENNEHTGYVGVRSQIRPDLWGDLKYAHSWRTGDDYVGNRPYLEGHSSQFVATQTLRFESHPELKKFYEASRNKDDATAHLNYMPTEQWTLGLAGGVSNERFSESELGLNKAFGWTGTFEASYTPNDKVSVHAFYTYDRRSTQQNGWSWNSAATANNLTRRWEVETHDTTHTLGVGGNWKIWDDLRFSADYNFVRAVTNFDLSNPGGGLGNVIPLDDVVTNIHSFKFNASYDITERLTVGLGYGLEYYTNQDWALGVGINAMNRVTTIAEQDPDYLAHVVAVGLKVKY